MPKLRLIVPTLLALSLPVTNAQTPDTATLAGSVVDTTHASVAGAQVSVTNLQTGLHRTVVSTDGGKFSIAGLPIAGAYEVVASKTGFAEAHLASTTLAGGSTADIVIELSVAGGNAEVTVTGAAGEVRLDQPQLGIHLDAHPNTRNSASKQSHHLLAFAQRRQPPRHQPGRHLHGSKSLHYQRSRSTPNLV